MRSVVFGLFVAFATLISPASAQQAKQDFRLVNRTGFTISEVFVSPAKADDWEEDVLGDDELDNGQSTTIKFSRKTTACVYDLKVTYSEDDEEAVWNNIDLCQVSTITLHYDRAKKTTRATFD